MNGGCKPRRGPPSVSGSPLKLFKKTVELEVVLLLTNGVVLVIVALGALHREAEEGRAEGLDAVNNVLV